MLVVDASVLVVALADDGSDGSRARVRLSEAAELLAPEIVDLEVLSVLRRHASLGRLNPRRTEQALADLDALPMRRLPHRALLARCWQLRDNLTPYDAAYVAAAEMFEATLLTADARIAGAPGPVCEIEVIGNGSVSG